MPTVYQFTVTPCRPLRQPARDGQIEAKGYKIGTEDYLPMLYYQIGKEYYSTANTWRQITYFYSHLVFTPKSYFLNQDLSFLQRFFATFTDARSALNNIGVAYYGLGFPSHALRLLRTALELNKWDLFSYLNRRGVARSWTNLGRSYRKLDQYDNAVSALKNAIEIDPKYVWAWDILGDIYGDIRNYNGAIQAYKKAIEIDPRSARSWNSLGTLYLILKDVEEALIAYRKAVELSPERGMYRSSLVGCLHKTGREVEAVKEEKVARSSMENESEYNRACFESVCGNTNEALRLLKLTLEQNQIDLEWAQQDPDFDFIREDPRFKELVGLE